jgi:hypothetical protein
LYEVAMRCFPLKTACEEKARLLRRHAAAESYYHQAIHVLSAAIASVKKPDANELEDFAESARKIVEGAWEALERHTSEHGC